MRPAATDFSQGMNSSATMSSKFNFKKGNGPIVITEPAETKVDATITQDLLELRSTQNKEANSSCDEVCAPPTKQGAIGKILGTKT